MSILLLSSFLTPWRFELTHRLWSVTVHLLAIQPVVSHARRGELVCHLP